MMTPPLCTWDFVVGRKLRVEGGGLLLNYQLLSTLLEGQSGSSKCYQRLQPGCVPEKRVIIDMNASVLSSRCSGSPRRTCDLSKEKAFGASSGPLRWQ